MKRIISIASIAIIAVWIVACGYADNKPTANNANTNTNTNAAKPTAAAPTKEALLDMEKKANEAYIKGDGKFFEGFLSDKFVMYEGNTRHDKADTVKMIAGVKCDIKTWSLDDPQMTMIDADTAAIVAKATWDGTCSGPDGKSMKVPSPMRTASVYTRSGDKWMGAFHGETLIVDPKNPPKDMPPPPPAEKKDAKPEANSNTAAPAADPNTDAMLAVEKSGWEAWKARDPKQIEAITTKNISFVDLFGNYTATQADTIKSWTGGKCEIKSVSVTDAAGVTLSPTVGMLHFKGSGDGTCEGNKIMPLWGTSFYIKEGNAWKLAFGFEAPAM